MNKKTILSLIGILILVGGIVTSVTLVQKQRVLRSQAVPATELFLRPASTTASPGEETSFNIVINTGENIVAAASLQLLYDPDILTFTDVSPGSFFNSPVVLNKDTSIPGKIIYELGAPPNSPVQSDGQTLARVRFTVSQTATPNSSTHVKFLLNTQVSAIEEGGKNVLIDSHDATIKIQASSATITSTSSPTSTPLPVTTSTPVPTSPPVSSPTVSVPTLAPSPIPTSSLLPTSTPAQLPQTGLPLPTIGIISVSFLVVLISFFFFI